jgi:hypothetical protein
MKQKLLYFILPVILFTATLQAQIKVWNFATTNLAGYNNVIDTDTKVQAILYSGTGSAIGSPGAAASTNTIGSWGLAGSDKVFYVNDLGGDRLRGDATGITFYNIETKANFSNFWSDVEWGRMYSNGSGSDTKRYYGFNLTAGDVISLYYYVDTSVANNTMNVVTPSGSSTFNVDNSVSSVGQLYKLTAAVTGLYKFYCSDGKLCMGRIYEGDVTLTLGIDAKSSPVSTNVRAAGNRIYVSNVKTSTEVKIYSITGAIVKEFKTNSNMEFTFKSGLYIATIKTFEGQKSVKLLLN